MRSEGGRENELLMVRIEKLRRKRRRVHTNKQGSFQG